MKTASRALSSLRIALLGIIGAWALFIFGVHYLFDQDESVNWSVYFFLAAVIMGGGAALWAKRRTQKLLDPPSAIARSVHQHAVAILIAATVAGAWALFIIFVNLLITDHTNVVLRIVNTYLPIVLFTIVVVYFLLAAFVFNRAAAPAPQPVPTRSVPASPDATGRSALAYAVPIIGAAVGAITAGIIYDVTGTALTAWLWAIVFVIVAVGIIIGTHFASSGSSGASGLNFAWVIAFVVVSLATAFGYGAASVDELHLEANLTIDAYDYDGDTLLSVNGMELDPASEVVITAEPDGQTVASVKPDSDGWLYQEVDITEYVAARVQEFNVEAHASDGSAFTGSLTIEVDDGRLVVDDDASAYVELSKNLPASPGWFVKDLLPGLVMLLTGLGVMYLTVPMRARSHAISQNG